MRLFLDGFVARRRFDYAAIAKPSKLTVRVILFFASHLFSTSRTLGETKGCGFRHTRKLPRIYPNSHDASPIRASTLFGSSSLGGVPLSPQHLWSAHSAVIAERGALVSVIDSRGAQCGGYRTQCFGMTRATAPVFVKVQRGEMKKSPHLLSIGRGSLSTKSLNLLKIL